MSQKNLTKMLSGEFKNDGCFNFYDWFCSDNVLEKKARGFFPKIKFLIKEEIINPQTVYVWFKNNCPMDGNLYDDMRISQCDEYDKFLGGICPSNGHNNDNKGKCDIWGLDNGEFVFQDTFNSWCDLKNEIKTNPEYKKKLQSVFYR